MSSAPLHQVHIVPAGVTRTVAWGAGLADVLFDLGVEFPCGGRGQCGGCRVKVKSGFAPVTPEDRAALTPEQLSDGWRLACRMTVRNDLTLELGGWAMQILADSDLQQVQGGQGFGLAIDLGTTTIVGQLVELSTGRVLATRSDLNVQARFGADIMSRVAYGLEPEGLPTLTGTIREQIGAMAEALQAEASVGTGAADGTLPLAGIVLVGNTVMHHLFCGHSVEPLSQFPFETPMAAGFTTSATDLGWRLSGNPEVSFLPCLGGFVGSDVLAGVLAAGLAEGDGTQGLIDLGTNGEIVVAAEGRLLCASTAAGPAFEGARIHRGMRAAAGAIDRVRLVDGRLECHVLGGGRALGICGSGLVDAIACGLEQGAIQPSGRLSGGLERLALSEELALTQRDIRELQLAKAAIAAGITLLLERVEKGAQELETLYLAGAFGNYIHLDSARAIGMIPAQVSKVVPIGNSALHGAKTALLARTHPAIAGRIGDIVERCTHLSLSADAEFMDRFAGEMGFPEPLAANE